MQELVDGLRAETIRATQAEATSRKLQHEIEAAVIELGSWAAVTIEEPYLNRAVKLSVAEGIARIRAALATEQIKRTDGEAIAREKREREVDGEAIAREKRSREVAAYQGCLRDLLEILRGAKILSAQDPADTDDVPFRCTRAISGVMMLFARAEEATPAHAELATVRAKIADLQRSYDSVYDERRDLRVKVEQLIARFDDLANEQEPRAFATFGSTAEEAHRERVERKERIATWRLAAEETRNLFDVAADAVPDAEADPT